VQPTLVESSGASLYHKLAYIHNWSTVHTIQHSVNFGGSGSWVVKHGCCTSDVFGHLVKHTVLKSALLL
jgi:hypothetical protein